MKVNYLAKNHLLGATFGDDPLLRFWQYKQKNDIQYILVGSFEQTMFHGNIQKTYLIVLS